MQIDEKILEFYVYANRVLQLENLSLQRIDVEVYTFCKFLLLRWEVNFPFSTPLVADSKMKEYIEDLAKDIVGKPVTFNKDQTQFWFMR